jgi:hypothetical protein
MKPLTEYRVAVAHYAWAVQELINQRSAGVSWTDHQRFSDWVVTPAKLAARRAHDLLLRSRPYFARDPIPSAFHYHGILIVRQLKFKPDGE